MLQSNTCWSKPLSRIQGIPLYCIPIFWGSLIASQSTTKPMNIAGFRESSRSKKIACVQASPIPWTLRPLSSFRGLGRAIYSDITFNFQNSYKDSTRNFCILFCQICQLFTYTSFFHLKVGWKHFSVYFLRTKTFAYISRVALWEWRDIIFVEYYYLIQSLC